MTIFFKHMTFTFGSLVTRFNQYICFIYHSLQETTSKLLQTLAVVPVGEKLMDSDMLTDIN